MSTTIVTLLLVLSYINFALSAQCVGNPPMYNGLPCATTTRYWDEQKGACGCGSGDTNPFSFQWEKKTAAASQVLYDPAGGNWCGSGCGTCYELIPTGDCIYGDSGSCATQTAPITIMITNLCPFAGNEAWCPNSGVNSHGYGAHFDLMDYNYAGWVDALGWNNPVVTYRRVSCGSGGSPSCDDRATCQCGSQEACAAGGTPSSSVATTSSVATSTTSTSTTKKPTTTTTTTSSTSAHATTSTSGGTGSASGSCKATIKMDQTTTWTNGGILTITITNTGTLPIKSLNVNIPSLSATNWNLVATSDPTLMKPISWAFPINPGTSFSSAGFQFTGPRPYGSSVKNVVC